MQTAADVELVLELVRWYMENERSIILAVVSAKNDYANQIVLKLAKQVDPRGSRTLGVITKPDTLPVGSESELGFVNLARNRDVDFRLGWHVLKNRDYESRNCTAEVRDQAEEAFFSRGIWQEVPRDLLGVNTLRPRLSKVLLQQIRAELPNLLTEIEANIKGFQRQLDRLGGSRAGLDEQRLFLLHVTQSFQSLVRAAADGTYDDAFFGDPRSIEGYSRRLRAVIQNLNLDFAHTMRTHGHRWQIVEKSDQLEASGPTMSPRASSSPEKITRQMFITRVRDLLRRSRGRELPGMFSPLIVSDLFSEQSAPWEGLARRHIEATWNAARTFLDQVMSHLMDEKTAESLLREVIDPLMERRSEHLDKRLKQLLAPYQKGHPITYNHYFTETVQNVREKRLEAQVAQKLQTFVGLKDLTSLEELRVKKVQVKSLVSALAARNQADMDSFACSEVLDCMEAYYKVITQL